jgi:hypothetical protein
VKSQLNYTVSSELYMHQTWVLEMPRRYDHAASMTVGHGGRKILPPFLVIRCTSFSRQALTNVVFSLLLPPIYIKCWWFYTDLVQSLYYYGSEGVAFSNKVAWWEVFLAFSIWILFLFNSRMFFSLKVDFVFCWNVFLASIIFFFSLPCVFSFHGFLLEGWIGVGFLPGLFFASPV